VIAGHHGDAVAGSETFEKAACKAVFVGQAEVHQIAGDGEVIETASFQVGGQRA
jgi:hypothetical protein